MCNIKISPCSRQLSLVKSLSAVILEISSDSERESNIPVAEYSEKFIFLSENIFTCVYITSIWEIGTVWHIYNYHASSNIKSFLFFMNMLQLITLIYGCLLQKYKCRKSYFTKYNKSFSRVQYIGYSLLRISPLRNKYKKICF